MANIGGIVLETRILHIVYSLGRAGLESRIMDLYRNIDRGKYQFDFYIESGEESVYDKEVLGLGGKLYYAKHKKNKRMNIPNLKEFYCFLVDNKNYRIVYAYDQWAGMYLKQALRAGVPIRIASSRASYQSKNMYNYVRNIIKLNVNKYSTHRFAVSKEASLWLFGKKKSACGDVTIWPNAIDAFRYSFSNQVRTEVRLELGIENGLTIMHVGNFTYEKNHPFLFEIFSEVLKRCNDAKLVLVGKGNPSVYQSQLKRLGIDRSVIFLGAREDVPRLLCAGDVFVFPSFSEGFPGAVLEAQASGLKCLISDSITREVKLTENVAFESLKKGPSVWAKAIFEMHSSDRENAWTLVKSAGYDISSLARIAEGFYGDISRSI